MREVEPSHMASSHFPLYLNCGLVTFIKLGHLLPSLSTSIRRFIPIQLYKHGEHENGENWKENSNFSILSCSMGLLRVISKVDSFVKTEGDGVENEKLIWIVELLALHLLQE